MKPTAKTWQIGALILFCLMILLNIRILYISNQSDAFGFAYGESNLQVVPCEEKPIIQVLGTPQVENLNASDLISRWTVPNLTLSKMMGYHRKSKGFLTIGIPSIKRINGPSYLLQTIRSIIRMTSTADKTQTVILVFLADFDEDYNNRVVSEISLKYNDYINMGFIQVVQINKSFYPPLEHLKQNFNDKPDRVKWRSKQVLDFAFMFMYSKNISQYYVQLEDDVVCAPNFVPAIRAFIQQQTKHWAMLEFSELGFIGKLFKTADLEKFSKYLWTFYEEQPVDWLMTYFRLSMAQKQVILRKPTLFQHIGLTSSFDTSKPNKLKDRFFAGAAEQGEVGDNPPATVFSDIPMYDRYSPDEAYSQGAGFFWGKDVKKGQALYIVFTDPQSLTRVVITSGAENSPKDIFKDASLEVSDKLISMDQTKVVCGDYFHVAKLWGGGLDKASLNNQIPFKTKCLRIIVNEDQMDWVLVKQILVFVKH